MRMTEVIDTMVAGLRAGSITFSRHEIMREVEFEDRGDGRRVLEGPLSGLLGRKGGNRQRVDRTVHHVPQRCVNKAMPRQWRRPSKIFRNDPYREVTATLASADMPGVQMRVISNLNLAGFKELKQPCANQRGTIRLHSLSAVPSDRTTHSACRTPNPSVSPPRPNILKYTHVDSLNL